MAGISSRVLYHRPCYRPGPSGAHPKAGQVERAPLSQPQASVPQRPRSPRFCSGLPSQAPSHPLWCWTPLLPRGLGTQRSEGSRDRSRAAPGCPSPGADLHGHPWLPARGRPSSLGLAFCWAPSPLWPGHRPAPSLPAARPGELAECRYRLRKASHRLPGGAPRIHTGPRPNHWGPLAMDRGLAWGLRW